MSTPTSDHGKLMTGGEAILTAAEMRAAEQAVFTGGTAEYDVMERAGAAAADIIWRVGGRRPTLVLCGPGNNGGDGFVIARILSERGVPVRVAATGESRTPSSQQARAAWDGPVEDVADAAAAVQLVDALFGTGFARGLDAALADRLTSLVEAASHSYAIDLPSGVETDTGRLLSPVPRFDICIALAAYKPAHVLRPASGSFAQRICVDIGIPMDGARAHLLPAPRLSAPDADAHKYRRGLVAVLGGAMPGAAALATGAAAKAGAGYVRLVGGDASALPHAVVAVDGRSATAIRDAFADSRIGAVLAGPGLGRDDKARSALAEVLKAGHASVLDADALLHLRELGFGALPVQAILTPHEGEFQTLFGDVPGSKIDRARAAAAKSGAVLILKGPDTVIAAPDGRVLVSDRSSSWLSTAGTGDVLAGICAARLARSDAFMAAAEAVWLHGEAARRAGPAFIADDLIAHIPAAIASRL